MMGEIIPVDLSGLTIETRIPSAEEVARLRADLARWQRIARDRLRLLKAERKARGE